MEFSRHARNHMRRMKITRDQVEAFIAATPVTDHDPSGKPRRVGFIGDYRVRVVVALDNPDFVVNVHERRN